MKIVVLDGYALNPGDLSWAEFEALGDLTVYDRSTPEEAVERARGCDALITNKALVSSEIIHNEESLQYIGVLATGVNIVDVDAATELNIPVCNVVGYGPESVAQMVFAHILNFTHRIAEQSADAKAGGWARSPDFCYWNHPLIELKDLTLGIIGFGQIGEACAKIGHGFGMDVTAYTHDFTKILPSGVSWRSLGELFSESDIVTLHCPLTEKTENLVDEERIQQMKKTAILINTGRGQLVDEEALAKALNEGRIAGAGLDVLSTEPPDPNNPLLSAKNCFITPHTAWATQAARSRLMSMAADNLKAFQDGEVTNCVNL
ncbi:MAG: D-2-hydroxyacid dehydrogenase [Verrucomicrobia bacterium]|nr:D-2-hydroxyacid dehydrogenase [Verrucomicrobiota bacterium]MDA1065246.1 D-2-hydroxyacid dehydrogenase [Verrucomicrobiota bacterium]